MLRSVSLSATCSGFGLGGGWGGGGRGGGWGEASILAQRWPLLGYLCGALVLAAEALKSAPVITHASRPAVA